MRLVFFAETTNPDGKYVFGDWDMHETLPEEYWHYYQYPEYPSSSGLSVKWVSEVIIYSSEEAPLPEWSLTLNGAFEYNMSQAIFENSVNCHPASWTDGDTLWEGIPLWRFVGFVDDDDQHSDTAFNDAYAAAGYDVKVIASDGYSKTFASADVARNENMIIANTANGTALPEEMYPLRLVGPDLSGGQQVSMITEIQLLNLPHGEASSALNATANVVIEMMGIELNRTAIDYGNVMPGESSAIETVLVTNIGTLDCDVTMEVDGADAIAQSFYEQSLYIDGGLYDIDAVIANILAEASEDVDTQLQVPLSWAEGTGAQDATFIFWATASD
jgi:hypothetical protein